ncbi:MAG TPA: HlyD family efflux transporter periplasmic adaptor subunit [Puia sp.]|nr:HlyD family efflux transporter periplasmic adaptor subunit [Puia sp.]
MNPKIHQYLMLPVLAALLLGSCSQKNDEYDASGNFEADETIVSARQNGQLLSFTVREGDTLARGAVVGQIDVTGATLQKEQAQASIQALHQRTTDPRPQLELVRKQIAVQQAQLDQQLREKARTQRLVAADAATTKQLDDINSMIDQLQRQISVSRQQLAVQETVIANQNRSVLSEQSPLQKSVAQYEDQVSKGVIVNPVGGTVLTKYALEGEMATTGKALYKIANLDTLLLRAYITGTQLPHIRLGQQVTVRIDAGNKAYKSYPGAITWVSDKSEFTPKTIQTKDERANLVYAMKVRVKNDGFLKIGMYAEVKW